MLDGLAENAPRVMATSRADLSARMEGGAFREDLFHRLAVVPVRVPALSERRDDIPELVAFFMEQVSANTGLPRRKIGADAMAVLQSHDWPGNIRQLRNVIERVLILAESHGPILPSELEPQGATPDNSDTLSLGPSVTAMALREARELFEREYLLAQINRFGGNISRTAQFVGMERSALHRKLKSLGVVGGMRVDDDVMAK